MSVLTENSGAPSYSMRQNDKNLLNNSNEDNNFDNIIKLKLKKPDLWKWELSTSASTSNINFPRILLYDNDDELLADACDPDIIINCDNYKDFIPTYQSSETLSKQTPSLLSSRSDSDKRKSFRKSTSSITNSSSSGSKNNPKIKRNRSSISLAEINENLNDVFEYLKTEGINYKLNEGRNSLYNHNGSNGKTYKETSLKNFEHDQNNQLNENINLISSSSLNCSTLNTNEANKNNNNNNNNNNINVNKKLYRRSLSHDNFNKKTNKNENCVKLEKPFEDNKNNEQDIWIWSGKGLIKRDFNSKEFNHLRLENNQQQISDIWPGEMIDVFNNNLNLEKKKSINKSNTQLKEVRFADLKKSKSTTAIVRNSSSVSDKKKCRRQTSTPPSKFANSILERMSAFNMGSSADSHHDLNITQVNHGPRYFLRTSKAGTLVVCEESFSKARRRPKSIAKIYEKDELQPVRQDRYYDDAIQKLDNLINNVTLKENNNNKFKLMNSKSDKKLNQKLDNNKLQVIEDDKFRGKSVDKELKDLKQNNTKKQLKNIRRCISAGNVYISSSEDEQNLAVPKLQSKLRRKRKSPFRMQKGEQQLLNSNKNNTNCNQLTPSSAEQLPISNKLINNKYSIQQLDDYSINYNNNNVIPNHIQKDSILKDFDENVEFEIIKNDLRDYDIDENSSNLSDDETILEILVENNCNNNNNLENIDKNMGSNVSRNVTASKERGRSHSSGDIHSIKQNNNSFYHLSSNNPNEKFNFDKNKKYNQIKLNKQKLITTTKYGINNIKYNNLSADNNIDIDECGGSIGNCSNLNGSGINNIDTIDINQYIPSDNQSKLNLHENLSYNVTFLNLDNNIREQDRIKFRGSLPNNLDTDTFVNIDDDNMKSYYLLETSKKNPLTTNITNLSNQQNTMTTDCADYVTVTRHQQEQLLQNKQNNSMNCNTSENKIPLNSTSFSTNNVDCGGDGSSSGIKINQEKPDIQLILPSRNFDPSCDQGYGSERSPEEEHAPTILNLNVNDYDEENFNGNWNCAYNNGENGNAAYDFITEDCTFSVHVVKGPRGLGLSISGGIDTNTTFPGIIRIKRVFPHQSAYLTGQLQPGDIILEANSIPLTGLTNYEALEVLRNIPNDVHLVICRPVDEEYKKLSPPTEPPKPPQRLQQQSIQTQTVFEDSTGEYYNSLEQNNQVAAMPQPSQPNFHGEFEIIMVKEQGSLGFTLRKEDESILGHYVRALVKEPALSDNRIKIGDKIVAVNDVDLSQMTHEQAVIFLRQSGDVVKLRLYRDRIPTPVEATTPDNINLHSSFSSTGKKTLLRPEAINLLTDLAHKKQNSLGDSTESSNISINSSPRRLKRGPKSESSQSEQDNESKCSSNPKYLVSSQTSTIYSDSDQSIDSRCSYTVQKLNETLSQKSSSSPRPNFLDLSGNSSTESNNSTPKNPIYQFSGNNNVYNLNNLDNDTLDAPYKIDGPNNVGENYYQHENKLPSEINHDFISLPCEVLLQSDLKKQIPSDSINIKNPVYQSVHINQKQHQQQNDQNIIDDGKLEGNESLLKWKGVVLAVENPKKNIITPEATTTSLNFKETGENLVQVEKENHDNLKELNEFSSKNSEGYKVISVELNRGWNSRLGFSLQPIPNYRNGSYISAIYNDSVAARDGRLKAGDILVSVNDDSVENLATSEIIDLLRIIRGLIVITVLRKDL